jgi:hypothetical protein
MHITKNFLKHHTVISSCKYLLLRAVAGSRSSKKKLEGLLTARHLILPEYKVVLTDSNTHLYSSDAASDGK